MEQAVLEMVKRAKDGDNYETIAAVLKVPLGTVKSRIHAGLQKLKQSMGGITDE